MYSTRLIDIITKQRYLVNQYVTYRNINRSILSNRTIVASPIVEVTR